MTFKIKGFNDGLLVTLSEGDWKENITCFLTKIEAQKSFYKGAKIVLDFGGRGLSVVQLSEIRADLGNRDISLFAILSQSKITEKNAKLLGLETNREILEKPRKRLNETLLLGRPAIFINKTIRSGNKVEYDGSVVIHGDVNPGAEIIVVGSVMVWGKLYGNVIAGSNGDQSQIICALCLKPSKLRIANISFPIEILQINKNAVKAYILDNTVVINAWDFK